MTISAPMAGAGVAIRLNLLTLVVVLLSSPLLEVSNVLRVRLEA